MDPRIIQTRDEFIEFISDVARDYELNGHNWENRDIRSYLEAIAAWLEDCDGYYQNVGPPRDVEVPHWQVFADAVSVGRVYE